MEKKMETTISDLGFRVWGDLVRRLRVGISGLTIWVIGVLNLLTNSP